MAGNEPFVCNFGAFFTYTIYLVEKKSGEVSCVVIGVKRRQSDSTVFLIFNVFACNFSGCSGINTQDVFIVFATESNMFPIDISKFVIGGN